LEQRIAVCAKFLEVLESRKDQIAMDISGQMGRPLKHAYNEINGVGERTRAMMACAPAALATEVNPGGEPADSGFYKVTALNDRTMCDDVFPSLLCVRRL